MWRDFVNVKHRTVGVDVFLSQADLFDEHWQQLLEREIEVLHFLYFVETFGVDDANVEFKQVRFGADLYL